MLAHFQQLAIRHWLVGLANCSPAQPVEWTVWMNHLKPALPLLHRGAHWIESRLFTSGQADPEEFRPVAVVKECAGSTPDDRLIWSVIEQLNGELAEGDKLFKQR